MSTDVWYQPEFSDDRGQAMVKAGKALSSNSDEQFRLDESMIYARMYEGRPMTSLYQFGGAATRSATFSYDNRSTWNVLRSVCGAGAAQVAKSRPRPRFLTNGADRKTKKKAKKLQKFCDGLFKDARVYEVTQRALVDSTVFPTGVVQIYVDHDRVKVQRCFDCEIFVEYSPYGEPQTLYRRRFQDRFQLHAKFGEDDEVKAFAIASAKAVDPIGTNDTTNLIEVWEAWRLPSAPGADDGHHIIAIDQAGGSLFTESWSKPYWPLVFFRWEAALTGFSGTSLASILAPIQVEINKLLSRIEKAQRVMCVPRLWVPPGKMDRITNEVGELIRTPQAPQALTFAALAAEIYQHLERHVSRAYEEAGLSRDTAQGSKDAGVNSAIAIRESLDVGAARLALPTQRWEQAHVDIAKIMVDMARDLYTANKSYKISAPGTKFLESIDWKDCDLAEDEYDVDVQPASLLPTTAAGRIDTVQDLVKSGVWTQDRAAASLDELDPESEMSLERAAEKNIEKQIDAMLDGKAAQPDKFTDLSKAIKLCGFYINEAEEDGVDDKHVDLVRRYADACFALQKKIAQANQPPAPAPAAPAPAQAAVAA
jgi:hypothetical protein